MSASMASDVYGDRDGGYEEDGFYDGEGTDIDGAMTLDMVTEVDEGDFDEDVCRWKLRETPR